MDGVTGRKVTLTEMPKILNPVITFSVFLEFHSYHLCIWQKKKIFFHEHLWIMTHYGIWIILPH